MGRKKKEVLKDDVTPILEVKTANNITEEQKTFIEYPINKDSLILRACAGSGKTFSSIERMKFLLKNGVDAKKIIFFSFTVAAIEELKHRIDSSDIKITTIHAFCMSTLSKMGKFKKICTFYDFINWFKEKNKPNNNSIQLNKNVFYEKIEELYDNAEYLSAEISSFKLQTAEGIKCKIPDYLIEYTKFLKESKSRDFSDMLIETRNFLKEEKWLRIFRNKYDYVFIDEYQDISCIQASILLSLNAKYYYLMGDAAQSIFGYSMANCIAVEEMVIKRRKTIVLNLSTNFRSAKSIVENSNKYSSLQAIPFHKDFPGCVHKQILKFEDIVNIIKEKEEVVILVRTNNIIKELEKRLLKLKIPIKYSNFITDKEIEELKKGCERISTKNKINELIPYFGSADIVLEFIEDNKNKKSFLISIHKSKGREFENCIIINSLSKEILELNGINLSEEQVKHYSFDQNDPFDYESKNVHYVAVSRAKKEMWFSIIDKN